MATTRNNISVVTNFIQHDLYKYELAIVEFKSKTGSDRLYIKNEAYSRTGNKLKHTMSLCDTEDGDLSEFWRIFEAKKNTSESQLFDNMQYYMEYCQKNTYITPQEWIKKYKSF